MKFFILFMVICLTTVYGMKEKKGHKENPEMKKWSEECAKEHNISLSAIKPKNEEKSGKKEVTNDFKCYKRCIAIKSEFLNETGEINYEKVKETFKVDDAKMEKVMNCTSTAIDKCDNYYEIYTCGMKFLWKNKTAYNSTFKREHQECPEIKKWSEECAKENNIDLSSIKQKIGELFDKKNISNEYKCFKRCVAIKGGFIDEAGKANYEKVKKQFKLDDAKIEEFKKCTSTAEDKCDNYYEIYTCSMKLAWKNKNVKGDKKGKKE